jgi:hypothetical protein
MYPDDVWRRYTGAAFLSPSLGFAFATNQPPQGFVFKANKQNCRRQYAFAMGYYRSAPRLGRGSRTTCMRNSREKHEKSFYQKIKDDEVLIYG